MVGWDTRTKKWQHDLPNRQRGLPQSAWKQRVTAGSPLTTHHSPDCMEAALRHKSWKAILVAGALDRPLVWAAPRTI